MKPGDLVLVLRTSFSTNFDAERVRAWWIGNPGGPVRTEKIFKSLNELISEPWEIIKVIKQAAWVRNILNDVYLYVKLNALAKL